MTQDPTAPARRCDPPRGRRRGLGLLAVFVLVGLGAAFVVVRLAGTDGVGPGPARLDEAGPDLAPPPLAVPPPRARGPLPGGPPPEAPSGTGIPGEPGPQERIGIGVLASFLDPNTPDAPELPVERVPLDVEVVGPDGAPVRFADVGAWWGSWRAKYRRTDASGRVRLDVPRHTTKLEVIGRDPDDPRPFLWVHYHAMRGDESSTRVVVRTWDRVTGVLVDEAGDPIVGGVVDVVPRPWAFHPVRTDAQGRFDLVLLAHTVVDVRYDPELPQDATAEGAVALPRTFAFARRVASRTRDLRLVARAGGGGGTVVRVRDERGNPLRARVRAERGGAGPAEFRSPDDAEDVVLRGLPPVPTALVVEALDPTGRFERRRLDDVELSAPVVEVVLRRTAPVVGRVVDPDGRPVAGATVMLVRALDGGVTLATDADGRFAEATGWSLGTRLTVEVRAPPGSAFAPVVVASEVGGPALELRLRPGPWEPVGETPCDAR